MRNKVIPGAILAIFLLSGLTIAQEKKELKKERSQQELIQKFWSPTMMIFSTLPDGSMIRSHPKYRQTPNKEIHRIQAVSGLAFLSTHSTTKRMP